MEIRSHMVIYKIDVRSSLDGMYVNFLFDIRCITYIPMLTER